MRFRLGAILLGLLCGSTMAAGSADRLDEALVLYDEGRFAEARLILEEVDASTPLDGSWLYRLAYCQRSTGSADVAAATDQRAIPRLESERAAGGGLEAAFYLSGAYRNVGRTEDGHRVAGEATAAVASGALVAESRLDRFRVGKLHADLNQFEQSRTWLELALEGATEGELPETYVRWANRYLARELANRGDAAALDRYLDRSDGALSAAELDRLAAERARAGDFRVAAAAWKKALALGPADPNRTRYAMRLAEMAASADYPTTAPSGQPWGALSKEELEAVMEEQAGLANALLSKTRGGERLDKAQRQVHEVERNEIRGRFTAAALEYTLQGHPIRETAFFKGYAPFILKKSAWKVQLALGK